MFRDVAYDFFINPTEWKIFKNMCFRLDRASILYNYTTFVPELKQYLDVIGCVEHTGPLDLWAYYCTDYKHNSNYLRIQEVILGGYLLDLKTFGYISFSEVENNLITRIKEAFIEEEKKRGFRIKGEGEW
jgi:hypothetical protein